MTVRPLKIVDASHALDVDDAELVARARAPHGDRWAEEMMYRRHAPYVAATARRLLRNEADTADVVQETFLIALESLGQLQEPAALRGWLARIAVSRVHRRFRTRKLKRLLGIAEGEDESLVDVASPGLGADERAHLAIVDERLRSMPMKLRVPWVLRFVVGYSLEETAMACDCSLATIKRHLDKAQDAIDKATGGSK